MCDKTDPACPCHPQVAPLVEDGGSTARSQVTNGDLYKALYDMEQVNARRYVQLNEGIGGVNQRMTLHEENHVVTVAGEGKITRRARMVGIVSAIATFIVIVAKAAFGV